MSSISLKLGYKYLRSNKGGSFSFTTLLAIIGLAIGISSLIVVTSVMNGFEKELEDRILGVIPHSVITSDNPISNYENIITNIKKNREVIDASPYINIQAIVSSSYDTRGISVIGVDPNIEKNMSIVSDYMLIGNLDNIEKDNSIIIGSLLAANIGAMLVAFISILSMINFTLEYFLNINLQEILGIIFSPLAWTMGIPWEEANIVGRLMGEKIVLTELIAYGSLGDLINNNLISERSAIISSYALCGFANFGSIGIQLGGIGAMAPEKRNVLSKIVLKAMVGGALASWLTATIAGILI